ncbi:type II toxin-antitoxin system RatA family toxin [Reinekea marinisedimentorum]|uniref:Ribosome-associated toxin RatA of RatAB toxin-antitoxin module n=1 Tax=Reinekea marinisedimentorum TaxID=230495 RepID=A0A4R3IAC8_9GAMM|nr:type II toxin-antitoxin system RatA family toxin [Reinekea marinisedimentorum]TCS43250.1 ribosome-associated toxin RatA of RatAB toxin-antitoxin module [Reinekea marinisedimentorum]
MIEIHRNALVLAPAEHLYNLINDIESYPLFLDGVKAAYVLEQSEQHMLGKLVIAKAGVEKVLVTRNQLVHPSSIEMNLEEGPLDYLNGTWSIKALGDAGCKVSLDLRFHAKKSIKGMAFSVMFKKIADQMVASFVARAQADYSVGKI